MLNQVYIYYICTLHRIYILIASRTETHDNYPISPTSLDAKEQNTLHNIFFFWSYTAHKHYRPTQNMKYLYHTICELYIIHYLYLTGVPYILSGDSLSLRLTFSHLREHHTKIHWIGVCKYFIDPSLVCAWIKINMYCDIYFTISLMTTNRSRDSIIYSS